MSTTITTPQGTTMTLRHPNLDILLSKHIVLEDNEKARLISELSLDDKRYLGNYLIDEELFLNKEKKSVYPDTRKPLDGKLTFGDTTYVDGVEVFVNNKE